MTCPKCGKPKKQMYCKGRRNGWECPTCRKEWEKARNSVRREKYAPVSARKQQERRAKWEAIKAERAAQAAREKSQREAEAQAARCLCERGGRDICPVHRPDEVGRRLMTEDFVSLVLRG